MNYSQIVKVASRFKIKLAGQAHLNIEHLARQAKGLSKNINTLLAGAGENGPQAQKLVSNLARTSQQLVNDSKQYGISEEIAGQYKSSLMGLLGQLRGLIDYRYHALLQPLSVAIDAFAPAAIPAIGPAMTWHPIGAGEPEDPEEEVDLPLPPGLGVGRQCPPGTPQKVCDLGYWPVGYDMKQHQIEMKQKS